jgi:6-pyruvoyltetrahydropterin/6-carboxytetrahydropterin synthase
MFEVSSEVQFSAAHHLTNYKGPCEQVHGHNWKVRATILCPELNESGIGIDFRILKNALNAIVDELDHTDLNTVFDLRNENPSSENIARYVYNKLQPVTDCNGNRVDRVEVSETPGNTAAYYE